MNQIEIWITEYFAGYVKYMSKHHPELFNKFFQNIHPPQHIGGGILLGKSARNTDQEYAEIMKITKEFCTKYPNPIDFPSEF
jgi:hypothetical protein